MVAGEEHCGSLQRKKRRERADTTIMFFSYF